MSKNYTKVAGVKKSAAPVRNTITGSTSTSELTLLAAAAAGLARGLHKVIICNRNAAVSDYTLRDGTAGAVVGIFRAGIGATLILDFGEDGMWPAAAATNWTIQSSAAGPWDALVLGSESAFA
jgi:hypothetical protein